MTDSRVSRGSIQALVTSTPEARVSRGAFQGLITPVPEARVSRSAVQALVIADAPRYLEAVLPDNPAVLWLLMNNYDSTGNGNTAIEGTSTTLGHPYGGLIYGYPTGGFLLGDGANSAIQNNIADSPDDDPYTLEAWVRTTAVTSGIIIGDMGNLAASSRGGIYAPNSTGKALARTYNTTSNPFDAVSTRSVNDGQIHYLVSVVGGGVVKLYFDGELEATSPAITGTFRAINYFRAGCTSGASVLFQGGAAGLAFYKHALTAEQVAAHYSAGLGEIVVPVTHYVRSVGSAAPVQMKQPDDSWWPMEAI